MRSFVIAPGLAAAGVPREQLLKASLYASVGISAFTLLMAVAKTRRGQRGR